jgi:hypothetical protein
MGGGGQKECKENFDYKLLGKWVLKKLKKSWKDNIKIYF